MIRFDTTCYSKLCLSWNGPYAFWLEDLHALPQKLAGVYVLCAFTPLVPALIPFYVGQSTHLRRRLAEHLIGARTFAKHLRRRLSTYFCIAVVTDPFLRTVAEAALIRSLRPAGNGSVPIAPRALVTPPPLSLLDT
jgi:hypothetical protein